MPLFPNLKTSQAACATEYRGPTYMRAPGETSGMFGFGIGNG